MRKSLFVLVVVVVGMLLSGSRAYAGGGGENVVLVVNESSWASMSIANEYIRLRNIPPRNIIYIKDAGGFESVYFSTFRDAILKPVLQEIERRGLVMQADYLVYSSDVPYAINLRREASEEALTRIVGPQMAKVLTPEASINGLTYLYMHVMGNDLGMMHLECNRYFRRVMKGPEPLKLTSDQLKALRDATQSAQKRDFEQAQKLLSSLVADHPKSGDLLYALAACRAAMGSNDQALTDLTRAVDAGFGNRQRASSDPAFEQLRNLPQFQALLGRMQALRSGLNVQPTIGFRGQLAWTPDGEPTKPDQGPRYLLSTMLAMTSGRGNSVAEAIKSLRRSVQADGTRPDGTIYLMSNNDVRSTTREWAIEPTVLGLRDLGVKVAVENGILPENKKDVAGVFTGAERFNWQRSKSTIMPGAICENLTSWGGVMKESGKQTPLSEFIRHGAAGASGTVTEPYAIQNKFPNAFMHLHYANGASLAEAFYQSVSGPYQLLIVGDPLCQPWAHIPTFTATVNGVESTDKAPAVVSGSARLEVQLDPAGPGISRYELFIDGLRVAAFSPSEDIEFDTSPFQDGWHDVRIVAISTAAAQTQGRVIMPVIFNNHVDPVKMSKPDPIKAKWEEPITIKAGTPGAAGMVLLHNGRPIGQQQGESIQIEVDSSTFGQGPVTIQPVAIMISPSNKQMPVHLAPIDIDIAPPAYRAAITDPGNLEKGIKLTLADGKHMPITAFRNNWLTEAGVRSSDEFAIEAWVKAPRDDVYQFQILANMQVVMEINGERLAPNNAGTWTYIPVGLKRGMHRLNLRAKAPGSPRVDIRFGGPGSKNIIGVAKHAP